MLTRLKGRTRIRGEAGFTLVELLVVMLILGLLAAIAIPSFFNQRDKARDAEAKATARTAQTAIETYATENDGSYAGATAAGLKTIESSLPSTGLTVTATSNTVSVTTSSDTGTTFTITRAASGTATQTCAPTGQGGCPSSGNWGG